MTRTPAVQHELWNRILDHLNLYFYKPDSRALLIALAQYISHFRLNDVPVWSFILGASATGKTAIVIKALSYLPQTYKLDTLSSNSFLSGFGKDEGILDTLKEHPNGTKNGIILIPDFSTILNMRHDDRLNLQSQLRCIYDGEYTKKSGNKSKMSWKGKVTLIAACTPSIENYWTLGHDLGERFLYYRMPETGDLPDLDHVSTKAVSQVTNELKINKSYKQLIEEFVGFKDGYPNITSEKIDWNRLGLISLSSILTRLRQNVRRDLNSTKKEIVSIEPAESPGRITKALIQISIGYTMLMREEHIQDYTAKLAHIIGWGSVPRYRVGIIRSLVTMGNTSKSTDLRTATNIPISSFYRTLEDMEALNIVTLERRGQTTTVKIIPEVIEHLIKAKVVKNGARIEH